MSREEYDRSHMPCFPRPWEKFRQELEARLDPVDPRRAIDLLGLDTYESDEEIKPVFVSRMPNHKVTGAAHADTVRSGKKTGYIVTKTALSNLKLNKLGEIEAIIILSQIDFCTMLFRNACRPQEVKETKRLPNLFISRKKMERLDRV
jgi:CRISPR/Cas system Type II protein with McrA/HNH and RuvC-like nuclease domain